MQVVIILLFLRIESNSISTFSTLIAQYNKKYSKIHLVSWLMPWVAEIERIMAPGQTRQKVSKTPSQ
jgi:hypothetical protein